jgi:hypothetical protein
MKLKFKLNLQQFGNVQDTTDADDQKTEKGTVTVTHQGVTYVLPASVYRYKSDSNFLGIGDKNDTQTNLNFTKYYIEKGGEIGEYGDFIAWLVENKMPGVVYDSDGNATESGVSDIMFGWTEDPEALQRNYEAYTNAFKNNITEAFNENKVTANGSNISAFTPTAPGQPPGQPPGTGLTPPAADDSNPTTTTETPTGTPTEPEGQGLQFTTDEGTVIGGPGGEGSGTEEPPQVSAFNQYYEDVYSLAPGTGGARMLGRLEDSYVNQAQQAATMADVNFQQAALRQAQSVKQITDQVRSERMERLRAGMSEAQIANQDMQMLMTNVNTLNQNAQMLNDQRLQAQIGMNTAQDQAYMDYLGQANQRGQIGAASAASDAGDAWQQTIRRMTTLYGTDPSKWTRQNWDQQSVITSGFDPNKTT